MLRGSPVWLCAALLACSAHAPAAPKVAVAPRAAAPPPERDDPALSLSALLPAGADRCVIARPGKLARDRVAFVARVSQAEPFAWLPELGLDAYATAQRERRDGPSARVTVLWLQATSVEARALLDAHAGVELRWDDEGPCREGSCPARARVLGPHVVSITRGEFPKAGAPGAEGECARLAARAPGAIELAFGRSRRLLGDLVGVPLRSTTTLTPAAHGLHLNRIELMRSMAEAALAQHQGKLAGERGFAFAGLASDLRVEQIDSSVHTDFDVHWDDLELAGRDDARIREADRAADERERAVLPLDAPPDLTSRDAVIALLAYRLDRAENGPDDERAAQLNAARVLLEAACTAQPDDEGLALLRTELLIAELHDAAAGRLLAREGGQRFETKARWQALERRAAAMQSEADLIAVLVAHEVADRKTAPALARAILERVGAGASYDEAERQVLNTPPR